MAGRSDRPAAGLVLHVTNIATPYRLPVYRAIRRRLLDDGGDLHVFFLGRGNRKREWKIPDEDMEGLVWTTATPDGSPAAEARAAIDRLRPDAVVLAWAMDPTALRLLLHCRRKGIPCLLLTGETPYTFSRRRFRRLLSIARLPFFRLADGFIAYGTKSRDYILAQGIDPGRVTIAINVVDTGFFCRSIESLHRSGESDLERARYRDRDGRPFACHLLFVGEMLSFKGLVQTLDAFALLAREDIALHIVGSGPMFDELKGIVAGKKLDEQVFFHGYHQKQELPFFYAFADILLFPSLMEIFGLVMVEGAAAGLPIIASVFAGGTADVVEHGVNGLVIDPNDLPAYARAMATLVDDPELRRRMGEVARKKAETELVPERSADGYLTALRKTWKNRQIR